MKFYDREEEISELRHFEENKPSMLVLTGARRVGKTELIKRSKEIIYLYVDDKKAEGLLLEEFFSELKNHVKIHPLINIGDWEQLIKLIFEVSKKHEISIAFDEFQRFLKINPSVINQFQKYWDLKENSKIFLVFSGSSIGMIRKIFIENNAPLFKRAKNIIYLRPFEFKVIRRILKDLGFMDFEEQIKIYATFGGIINFYSLMDFYKIRGFNDIFNKLIFRKYAPLKNEVREIFIEEFGREHSTYYSILSALANGKNTKKEIGDVVDIKGTSLSPYLYDLINILDIVKFELPFNEGKASKKGRYIIKNNFFKFWFRFIFRDLSSYESENFSAVKEKMDKDINSFFGHGFEDLCRELLEKKLIDVGFAYNKSGRWWSRKGEEVDAVAVNDQTKEILFAECKWQSKVNAEKVLAELKEKAAYVDWNKEKRKEYYTVFAKSFKEKIKQKNVYLFDLNDLRKIFRK